MSKTNVSKSREFKEKEGKAREGLRLSIERELVGDMIRLLDDKLYCDVTFVIEEQDFPAHVAILYARAPAFSQSFLPHLLSPSAVQSCIYIQNIKPEEFSVFLRSVYTENDVQDYSKTEYPWTEKVSWYYPNDEGPAVQYDTCNGLEDSIEESQIIDQTDHIELNRESDRIEESQIVDQTDHIEFNRESYRIEESQIVDQTDHIELNKEIKDDLKLEKKGTYLACQSENISELPTTVGAAHGKQKENDSSNLEVTENKCENVTCESLESSFKAKEPLKAGTLDGEEVDFIAMKACCKIGQELISLVNDSKTSDVTFLVNDNERIKAHRSILCTRSSYFSAMLYGGWSEGQATEIPLFGMYSSRAFLVVLYYLYGGITKIPLEIADICEVLRLSDMYGLEGLREVVSCQLKIEKCHLFHKPCSECIPGVIDCLDVSDLFQLSDLKSQSLRWIAKHFDRVYGTKSFASLNKALQDETRAIIQTTMNSSNVLDLLSRGEKLSSSIPRIKWAEPVLPLISGLMESCLSFIASNFPVITRQESFLDLLKGVGWSTPLLEKIFMAVRKHLTIQNCCEQLKEAMRLQNLLSADVLEVDGCEERFSKESYNLVDNLHSRCQEFIVSNLHRVSHTEGWGHLSSRTQTEIRKSKGGMFVDIGLPGQTKSCLSGPAKKARPTSKRSNINLSSRKTTVNESDSRVRPPESVGSSGRTTQRSVQSATSSRPGSVVQRPAQCSLGESSGLRSTNASRPASARGAGAKNSNQERPRNTTNTSEKRGFKEPQEKRKPLSSSLTTTNRNTPSTSRTVRGMEAKRTLSASVSQNLPARDSGLKSRSAYGKASNSMSTNRSSEKKQSSSKAAGNSSMPSGRVPSGFSRSCSEVNHAKLSNASGKRCRSDPSISDRRRKVEESFDSNKSVPCGGKISDNTSRKENTNSNLSRGDRSGGSRVKLARESVVGPVRLAQKSKSESKKAGQNRLPTKSNTEDQKSRNQTSSINVNQKDAVKNNSKQTREQTTKRPPPTQSIRPGQIAMDQNQTITIATESELDATVESTSSALVFADVNGLAMSETAEASPSQQDYSSLSLVQETKVSSELVQDNDPLMTYTEASPSQQDYSSSSSSVQETKVSSELVQDNDPLMTETEASPSQQDYSSLSLVQETKVSSELIQDNDPLMTEKTEIDVTF